MALWPTPARALSRLVWLAATFLGPPGLAWAVLAFDPPVGPLLPVLAFAGAVASLHGAQRLLRRAARGRARIEGDVLEIHAWDRVTRLPIDAITGLRPWRVAVPGPGLCIQTQSGEMLQLGIEDPGLLLDALMHAGPSELRDAALHALRQPAAADARAAAAQGRGRRLPRGSRTALRVVLWGLVPGCAFFYTHQSIVFGGFWGEYQVIGPRAWLGTFLRFWITCAVLTFVYSSLCRAAATALRWTATRVAPSHAARARRVAGGVDAVAYWAGVPALTALRYWV